MFRLLEKDGAPLHIGGRALDLLLVLAERLGGVAKRSSSGVTNMTATRVSGREVTFALFASDEQYLPAKNSDAAVANAYSE